MKFTRHFTTSAKPVVDQIQWKTTPAFIANAVDMPEVETPAHWSQNAVNILAKNYLRKAGVPNGTTPVQEPDIPLFICRAEPFKPADWDKKQLEFSGETSAKQVFHRMVGHWTYTAWKLGYFSDDKLNYESFRERNAQVFYDELYWMLANQIAAPNSPQFFNTGLWWAYGIEGPASGQWAFNEDGTVFECPNAYERPQVHACFIQPVSDDLVNPGGVMDLWTREVRLFKQGSGTGSNFSSIRGKGEPLSGGGVSSGLMSFLRIGDRAAGAIASGGTTRRAAKMVCLDADHPEIEDFIEWKVREEAKAAAMAVGSRYLKRISTGLLSDSPDGVPRALIDRHNNGFELEEFSEGWEGEAIDAVGGQNSNNSVRIPDEFFERLDAGGIWNLIERTSGKVTKSIFCKDLWEKICRAAWASADPGLQFHDTINLWHTCKADGEINASNPCSEYMFLDNTACNLASINLVRALIHGNRKDDSLDLESFEYATRLWTIVLDISVSMASFPSREIALGSYNYRTLGLGHANAGGLLMRLGLSYDSDDGRALISSLTALMHGIAYLTSAGSLSELGPFPRWEANQDSMAKVVQQHKDAVYNMKYDGLAGEVASKAKKIWGPLGGGCAYRNAQVTLLAPTGTISFVMDCDTTGIEPEFALIKQKALAGGGNMNLVNEGVVPALLKLGYKVHEANLIVAYIKVNGIVEGCPDLKPEHLAVFDCATPPKGRALRPMAHVLMVAAVQPFLSGAVSKTVNMPHDATVEDVNQVYREAHRLGLKAVAIYRDGSKLTQPLTTEKKAIGIEKGRWAASDIEGFQKQFDEAVARSTPMRAVLVVPDRGERERLPDRCSGYRQKFRVSDHPVYLHTGEYPDGRLGEVFIEMSDEGSTLRAMANALAKAVSIGIQHGTPVEEYIDAFSNSRFEPSGLVEGHDSIKVCSSVISAVFRDLGIHYFERTDLANIPIPIQHTESELAYLNEVPVPASVGSAASPRISGQMCPECGTLMQQTGACHACPNCSFNSGCG